MDAVTAEAPARDRFLALLAEQAKGMAVILLDLEGRVLSWNPGAERIFGYAAREILGSTSARLFVPEDVARGLDRQELEIGSRDGTVEDDRWMLRQDGSRFWAAGMLVALRDHDGRIVGYGKVLRNYSEVKEQIETLRNRVDALVATGARKDVFLSTLSHELRNPLAPLSSAVHLIRMTAHDRPDIEAPIGIIERQIHVLRRLVDDLLDVSRIAAGKVELRLQPTALADVVRHAVEAARPLMERRRHRVDVFVPSAPVVVAGDPERLEQVFVNLVNNAAKYTPEGGHVWVKLTTEGGEAVVRVEDDGIGIATDLLPRIFELFTQGPPSSGEAPAGLGIGLSLVRELVALHGGSVQVTSNGPGKGSEFTVRLPLAASPA
jgi:PAS domain S-box-containing protein